MIIEAKNLAKRYAQFELKNIDIFLPEGYIMGLIGPNGAGKTTTIKLLMNITKPDEGEIKLFGLKWSDDNEVKIKEKIGYVGEEQPFYDETSVKWTADFVRQFYPNWDDSLYEDLMRQFEIKESKIVGQLSKGNRVKFALALALAHRPQLLILDEPTSGLDPIIRREILEILAEFIEDGTCSVLFSTHVTEDLDKIADYIVLIDNGSLLVATEKEELLSHVKKVRLKAGEFKDLPSSLFLAHKTENEECIAVTNDFDAFRQAYQKLTSGKDAKAYGMDLSDIMLAYVKGEI